MLSDGLGSESSTQYCWPSAAMLTSLHLPDTDESEKEGPAQLETEAVSRHSDLDAAT